MMAREREASVGRGDFGIRLIACGLVFTAALALNALPSRVSARAHALLCPVSIGCRNGRETRTFGSRSPSSFMKGQ